MLNWRYWGMTIKEGVNISSRSKEKKERLCVCSERPRHRRKHLCAEPKGQSMPATKAAIYVCGQLIFLCVGFMLASESKNNQYQGHKRDRDSADLLCLMWKVLCKSKDDSIAVDSKSIDVKYESKLPFILNAFLNKKNNTDFYNNLQSNSSVNVSEKHKSLCNQNQFVTNFTNEKIQTKSIKNSPESYKMKFKQIGVPHRVPASLAYYFNSRFASRRLKEHLGDGPQSEATNILDLNEKEAEHLIDAGTYNNVASEENEANLLFTTSENFNVNESVISSPTDDKFSKEWLSYIDEDMDGISKVDSVNGSAIHKGTFNAQINFTGIHPFKKIDATIRKNDDVIIKSNLLKSRSEIFSRFPETSFANISDGENNKIMLLEDKADDLQQNSSNNMSNITSLSEIYTERHLGNDTDIHLTETEISVDNEKQNFTSGFEGTLPDFMNEIYNETRKVAGQPFETEIHDGKLENKSAFTNDHRRSIEESEIKRFEYDQSIERTNIKISANSDIPALDNANESQFYLSTSHDDTEFTINSSNWKLPTTSVGNEPHLNAVHLPKDITEITKAPNMPFNIPSTKYKSQPNNPNYKPSLPFKDVDLTGSSLKPLLVDEALPSQENSIKSTLIPKILRVSPITEITDSNMATLKSIAPVTTEKINEKNWNENRKDVNKRSRTTLDNEDMYTSSPFNEISNVILSSKVYEIENTTNSFLNLSSTSENKEIKSETAYTIDESFFESDHSKIITQNQITITTNKASKDSIELSKTTPLPHLSEEKMNLSEYSEQYPEITERFESTAEVPHIAKDFKELAETTPMSVADINYTDDYSKEQYKTTVITKPTAEANPPLKDIETLKTSTSPQVATNIHYLLKESKILPSVETTLNAFSSEITNNGENVESIYPLTLINGIPPEISESPWEKEYSTSEESFIPQAGTTNSMIISSTDRKKTNTVTETLNPVTIPTDLARTFSRDLQSERETLSNNEADFSTKYANPVTLPSDMLTKILISNREKARRNLNNRDFPHKIVPDESVKQLVNILSDTVSVKNDEFTSKFTTQTWHRWGRTDPLVSTDVFRTESNYPLKVNNKEFGKVNDPPPSGSLQHFFHDTTTEAKGGLNSLNPLFISPTTVFPGLSWKDSIDHEYNPSPGTIGGLNDLVHVYSKSKSKSTTVSPKLSWNELVNQGHNPSTESKSGLMTVSPGLSWRDKINQEYNPTTEAKGGGGLNDLLDGFTNPTTSSGLSLEDLINQRYNPTTESRGGLNDLLDGFTNPTTSSGLSLEDLINQRYNPTTESRGGLNDLLDGFTNPTTSSGLSLEDLLNQRYNPTTEARGGLNDLLDGFTNPTTSSGLSLEDLINQRYNPTTEAKVLPHATNDASFIRTERDTEKTIDNDNFSNIPSSDNDIIRTERDLSSFGVGQVGVNMGFGTAQPGKNVSPFDERQFKVAVGIPTLIPEKPIRPSENNSLGKDIRTSPLDLPNLDIEYDDFGEIPLSRNTKVPEEKQLTTPSEHATTIPLFDGSTSQSTSSLHQFSSQSTSQEMNDPSQSTIATTESSVIPFHFTIDADYDEVVGSRKTKFEENLTKQLAVAMRVPLNCVQNLQVNKGSIEVNFDLVPNSDHGHLADEKALKAAADELKRMIDNGQLTINDLDGNTLVVVPLDPPTNPPPASSMEHTTLILGVVIGAFILTVITVAIAAIVYKRKASGDHRLSPIEEARSKLPSYREIPFQEALFMKGSGRNKVMLGKYCYNTGQWLGPGPEPKLFNAPESVVYRPPTDSEIRRTPRPPTAVRERLKYDWEVDWDSMVHSR
ncbi:hypothetical protein HNY73_013347 [Argiope bruennichi]|uniref:Uncharacterized protein n=1 Tax=Argiope bruennichi TaxID=94029 RepID=A0A8T0EXQ7_ARGBR|nr:hypothetical protein HNY73_013347 [Argiope bruennichi]